MLQEKYNPTDSVLQGEEHNRSFIAPLYSPHKNDISTPYPLPSTSYIGGFPSCLQTALEYADRGIAVLPLAPGSKVPLSGTNGVKDATKDPETIKEWFRYFPNANVGIATGEKSGLFALDVDGEAGEKSLQKMIERLAETPPDWVTPTNETPGGRHILFSSPDDFQVTNSVDLRNGLDVRGEAGYIVAPPSIHPSGETYQWNPYLSIQDLNPVEAPEWLLDEIRPSSQTNTSTKTRQQIDTSDLEHTGDGPHPAVVATRRWDKSLEEIKPGERNSAVFWTKLTWCNLDQDPDVFDKWFMDSVFPELDKGPGHDGDKFGRSEAKRTLRNAEKKEYRKDLPDELKKYFTADTKPTYTKGPDQWSKVELCRILLAFFDRFGTLELDSRDVDEGGITEGLLEAVEGWINRHWTHRDSVPRSTLRNALEWLEESGHVQVEQKTHFRREKGRIISRYTTGTIKKTSPSNAVKEDLIPTDKPCCINGFYGDGVLTESLVEGDGGHSLEVLVRTSDPPDGNRARSEDSSLVTGGNRSSKSQLVSELRKRFPDQFDD